MAGALKSNFPDCLQSKGKRKSIKKKEGKGKQRNPWLQSALKKWLKPLSSNFPDCLQSKGKRKTEKSLAATILTCPSPMEHKGPKRNI
jgi:hypothetical protein